MNELLVDEGFDVVLADGAPEVLAHASKPDARNVVIVVDWHPSRNRVEAADVLLRPETSLNGAAVVVTTTERVRAPNDPAGRVSAVLRKPTDLDTVVNTIAERVR